MGYSKSSSKREASRDKYIQLTKKYLKLHLK